MTVLALDKYDDEHGEMMFEWIHCWLRTNIAVMTAIFDWNHCVCKYLLPLQSSMSIDTSVLSFQFQFYLKQIRFIIFLSPHTFFQSMQFGANCKVTIAGVQNEMKSSYVIKWNEIKIQK